MNSINKFLLIAGAALAVGGFLYYGSMAQPCPLPKLLSFLKDLKRQVFNITLTFVKTSNERLAAQESMPSKDSLVAAVNQLYSKKMQILLVKKDIQFQEFQRALQLNKDEFQVKQLLVEISRLLDEASSLQLPDMSVPAQIENITKQQIFEQSKQLLKHCSKRVTKLFQIQYGPQNQSGFLRQLDKLGLQAQKIDILRKRGWPDCLGRQIQYLTKRDERYRMQDIDFRKLMEKLQKVYEDLVDEGLKSKRVFDEDDIDRKYREVRWVQLGA